MTLTRWKLTIEYDGRSFSGWQLQDNAPSVQGALEQAIQKFCQQDIRVQAAGRTDAGVHARGQVAHFDLDYGDRKLSGFDMLKAINAHMLGHNVAVVAAEPVAPDFHARFHATNKYYLYCIINRPAKLALEEGFAWHARKSLDAALMHDAAQLLIGTHDFTTFRAIDCQAKSPVRSLSRLDVRRDGDLIEIAAEGRSFLHHQVRNIVGTLSMVGQHKWTKADVQTALDAQDRTKGGPTAPSQGLYLMRVDY